ncbi:hypothetical protein E2562_019556 [Oryza meyeriana var. granulata]|uniref:Translation initiation factor 5A C-terminal domain-containing protein n=1 Tax=Oryza meyeriana var. granulata TaxID=110450 RepID=A0A6G1BXM5_9ORYZ|nr:hypothetical protein E2562_019556 [Oryza meyeriana var. granulata]
MNERIEEQARAATLAAATQQKNNETQAEVEKLKEQLNIQAAERESDKSKILQLEQQLENTREELRREFLSLIAQQKEASAHTTAPITATAQPTELTTIAAATDNLVTEHEDAHIAQTVVETPMGMNNNVSDEPTAVNTPSLGGEHVQQTVMETPMAMNNNVYDEPTAVNTPSLGEHVQQVVEVSTSKTGKHGHTKCHFVAIDIFNGKKLEDIVPSSHNCDVPHVNRTEYQLIDISEDGFVSLLTENGNTKDDLRFPTDDNLLGHAGFAEGKDLVVTVMSTMGEEQICDQAIADGIPQFLKRLILLQTFGVKGTHVCQEADHVVIPPHVPPEVALELPEPEKAQRDIFAFFQGKMEVHPKNISGCFYSKQAYTANPHFGCFI